MLTSCPSLSLVYMKGKKMYIHSNSNFRFYVLGLDCSLFSEIVMVLSSGLVSLNLPIFGKSGRDQPCYFWFIYCCLFL